MYRYIACILRANIVIKSEVLEIKVRADARIEDAVWNFPKLKPRSMTLFRVAI